MNLPDFILIGETKSGSTSLFNYLIQHPNIKDTFGNGDKVDGSYATKEIRYFDRYYDRGLEWYKSCFPETKHGELTGEATPMYMYRSMVPFRIKKEVPNAKFLVILRNPVDRLYSNFQHYFKWVPNFSTQYPSFEKYLQSCNDRDYFMIDKGLYYHALIKWFKFFPRDQFYIQTTENLHASPQAVFSELLQFLGLEDLELTSFKVFRENKYEDMKLETRIMLEEFYRPYNKELNDFLKIDLNW